MNFKKAIVRKPGSNFADGLTTVDLGIPEYSLVLAQHAAYCAALRQCGLDLIELDADLRYPDSTFVEDTAVLTRASAIFTHPGAESREGEVEAIRPVLARFFARTHALTAPGTLDGGDICEAENHFFIGLSERTNEEGARQLAAFLAAEGYTSSCVSIHGVPGILHFKSGVTYIGDNTLLAIDSLAERPELKGYSVVRVAPEEAYAANCVRVKDRLLIPAGYPRLLAELTRRGFDPLPLEMSEFQKMDGGLSCLSLRF